MIEKETALKFLAAGLAVLPADKTLKHPVMAWKNYQEHRPVTADVASWFSDRHNAICLIRGKDSGKGVSLSTISRNASGLGTTSKERRELIAELIERQWITCNEKGCYQVYCPPPDLVR